MCERTVYTFGWHGDGGVVVKGATQTEFRGERRGRTGEDVRAGMLQKEWEKKG